jgi:hypothetical protein
MVRVTIRLIRAPQAPQTPARPWWTVGLGTALAVSEALPFVDSEGNGVLHVVHRAATAIAAGGSAARVSEGSAAVGEADS